MHSREWLLQPLPDFFSRPEYAKAKHCRKTPDERFACECRDYHQDYPCALVNVRCVANADGNPRRQESSKPSDTNYVFQLHGAYSVRLRIGETGQSVRTSHA